MDKQQFEAIVAACAQDPDKLQWLAGFCAGALAVLDGAIPGTTKEEGAE